MNLRLVGALVIALLSAASARAIIVYESPGQLTSMPVLLGGVKPGWQYIGTTAGLAGIPVGPRAWVTATHITGTASTGFFYDNAGTTGSIQYFGTRAATSGDLAVMVLDPGQPDFQEWAPVWSGTNNLFYGQPVYLYGYGVSRGSVVTNDVPVPGTPKGWYWSAYTGTMSYGTNQLEGLLLYGGDRYFVMEFNEPTEQNGLPGTEGILARFDSGGGVFSYNTTNARWELLGINYGVDQVSATSGGPGISAALYDARGFYSGTTQITGTAPVPLSSYATALPYKYDFLAPYIALPEPSAMALAAAAAGILALRGRSRSAGRSVRRKAA